MSSTCPYYDEHGTMVPECLSGRWRQRPVGHEESKQALIAYSSPVGRSRAVSEPFAGRQSRRRQPRGRRVDAPRGRRGDVLLVLLLLMLLSCCGRRDDVLLVLLLLLLLCCAAVGVSHVKVQTCARALWIARGGEPIAAVLGARVAAVWRG